MVGRSDPAVRAPAVAGRFYPADEMQCRAAAQSYLRSDQAASGKWVGAVVPHAGWVCSGAIAGEAVACLSREAKPDVVVIFGAVHTPLPIQAAALDPHQKWSVPTGVSIIPGELESKLIERGQLFTTDERFHRYEHAVEVELPLVQLAFPNAQILPIEVPANEIAEQIGTQTARQIQSAGLNAVFLASSDLTHYGPDYRFTPAGVGPQALQWAKENDQRLLRLITDFKPDKIVPETQSRMNACGGGAIAAMLSACREFGATRGQVLRHANSCETLAKIAPQPPINAVGYAGVIIG